MLRGALIALGISLVVSGLMVGTSYHFWESKAKVVGQLDTKLKRTRNEFRTLDDEREMIATYLPRYEELETLGVIGREYRLDWIERLREASQKMKLPDLSYAIETQESYVAEFPLETSVYQLYASDMNLDVGLLHGEDLITLLRALDARAKGLYSVSRCRLTRRRDGPGNPKEIHLQSTCQLRWFTIKKPAEEGVTS
jgi:hypothetical protein